MHHPQAPGLLAEAMRRMAPEPGGQTVIVCVGTDRSTGDALGPLVGTAMETHGCPHVAVYGTLEYPVHAANMHERLAMIEKEHPGAFIVAIDACLGRVEHVGTIGVRQGPLQPGRGVNKRLPDVGHIHIVGIVNIGGFMEYYVLQNTRLNLVSQMANTIVSGLQQWITGPKGRSKTPVVR